MRGIFGLLFAALASGHVVPYDLRPDETPALLERQAKPVGLTSIKVVPIETGLIKFGSGRCTEEQISQLRAAIAEARGLLTGARDALAIKKPSPESTPAYKDWFGVHRGWCATCPSSIRDHNFEAPLRDLGLPFQTSATPLAPNQLDPRVLTFTCWPEDEEHCRARLVAGTINPGVHPGMKLDVAGTLIGLCPRFFQSPDLQTVIQRFNGPKVLVPNSAGLTLLHEMQHVLATTGKNRHCIDVQGAYDAPQCLELDRMNKIKNAQNMAFYALDVRANPGRA